VPDEERENKMDEMGHEPAYHEKNYHPSRPYWRRMHTHWLFWVGVVLIFSALFIYITTVDLSLVPHRRHQPTGTVR
jgi:hypothetical protein